MTPTAAAAPAASPLKRFNEIITNQRTQDYLRSVLAQRSSSFVANVTALVSSDTKLQQCEPMTVVYAAMKATALDLPIDPNLGFAYVIPYADRKAGKVEAQFQMGYKGYIQLAIRSGQFKTINVTEVKEGELKSVDMLTGEIAFQHRGDRTQLPTIGYAAYFELLNGFRKTLYMTREEVEQHAAKYSQTYRADKAKGWTSSRWSQDFDPMAKKTVLKLLISKFAPLSIDMQQAVTNDQGIFDAPDAQPRYADNQPEEVEAEEVNETRKLLKGAMAAAMGKASDAETAQEPEQGAVAPAAAPEGVDPETGEIKE